MRPIPILLIAAFAVVVNGLSPRIVGGRNAPIGKYPFLVSLRSRGQHFCGGTIIDNRHILTAAHCFLRTPADNVTVHAGTNFLNETGVVYRHQKSLSHPDFDYWNQRNDVAVIRVNRNITFSKKVSPIPLAFVNVTREGQKCQLAGWGTTKVDGPASNALQEVDLLVISKAKCREFHWVVRDTHVCTFTKFGQGACRGDSGGPLVANGQQIGILSFSDPCAIGSPDVFTRVASFRKWIDQAKNLLK